MTMESVLALSVLALSVLVYLAARTEPAVPSFPRLAARIRLGGLAVAPARA
jgi:hypothetical protein